MEMAGQVECIALNEGTLLITSVDGRSWLTSIGTSTTVALPRSEVARKRASIAAAAIEGAIYAGLTDTDAQPQPQLQPFPRTLHRYVKWLAGNALFAAQTPALFREAAQRFEAMGRSDLAAVARTKAHEEDGHASLAIADLDALGLPGDVVTDVLRPPSAAAFTQRFRDHVHSDTPIALFGFSYCMERMAVARDTRYAQAVRALCPAHVNAYRFLDVHSAQGSDCAHVQAQLSLFESCTSEERRLIVRATFDTARLLARQHQIDAPLSSAEIERRLRARGLTLPRATDQSGPSDTKQSLHGSTEPTNQPTAAAAS